MKRSLKLTVTLFFLSIFGCSQDSGLSEQNSGNTSPFQPEDPQDSPHIPLADGNSAFTTEPGSAENPIPWTDMSLGAIYNDSDTCVTYFDRNNELATLLPNDIGFLLCGYSLEELAGMYSEEAIIEYTKTSDGEEYISTVKVQNSIFQYLCDDVEGCFYHLTMVDSIIKVNDIYIGMTKKQFFDLYPDIKELDNRVNNFTWNYDWMLCLKAKFENDTLISMKTGEL